MSALVALFMRDCAACGASEERVFEDSWTGTELCLPCLMQIGDRLTMSPGSEGDNMDALIDEINDEFDLVDEG